MRIVISLLMLVSVQLYAENRELDTPTREIKTNVQVVKPNMTQGKSIYKQYCVVCHQNGVAGAPKRRDAEDWKPRCDKKDLDALTASAIKGLNAMPAKGTCQTCSDDEIKAAVEYMVPKS